jgi:hypothetical protein
MAAAGLAGEAVTPRIPGAAAGAAWVVRDGRMPDGSTRSAAPAGEDRRSAAGTEASGVGRALPAVPFGAGTLCGAGGWRMKYTAPTAHTKVTANPGRRRAR